MQYLTKTIHMALLAMMEASTGAGNSKHGLKRTGVSSFSKALGRKSNEAD
jgi:hypothetical protein